MARQAGPVLLDADMNSRHLGLYIRTVICGDSEEAKLACLLMIETEICKRHLVNFLHPLFFNIHSTFRRLYPDRSRRCCLDLCFGFSVLDLLNMAWVPF